MEFTVNRREYCKRRDKPLNKLTERKTRLIFETPCLLRGRPLIVHVEAWGLRLREKRRSAEFEISWAQVHNRAAEIEPARLRQPRRERNRTLGAKKPRDLYPAFSPESPGHSSVA